MSRRISALLLSMSLLGTACGANAVRGAGDAGPGKVAVPIAPIAPIRPAQPAVDRAALRAALAERRQVVYQRFLAYREAQVYPINSFGDGFQHVWVDAQGNLCAAATLISGDWGRVVTARVGDEDNLIALASVQAGPLADWILTSGLTHQEIVAIQVPGWQGMRPDLEPDPDPRAQEIARLYQIYVDVERQMTTMWDANLDDAVDQLMAQPALARALLDGRVAGPGRFGATDPQPVASVAPARFAQPPPGK